MMSSGSYTREGHGQDVETIRKQIADYEEELRGLQFIIGKRVDRAALLKWKIFDLKAELAFREFVPTSASPGPAPHSDMRSYLAFTMACLMNDRAKAEGMIMVQNRTIAAINARLTELDLFQDTELQARRRGRKGL